MKWLKAIWKLSRLASSNELHTSVVVISLCLRDSRGIIMMLDNVDRGFV